MIIINCVGGLGNQMFQYALGKSLSLRMGVSFTECPKTRLAVKCSRGYAAERADAREEQTGKEDKL